MPYTNPLSFSAPPSLPPSLPLPIRPYRPHTSDPAAVMALIEEGREGAKVGRPAVASFVAKTLRKDMKLLEEGIYPGRFWVAEEEGEGMVVEEEDEEEASPSKKKSKKHKKHKKEKLSH